MVVGGGSGHDLWYQGRFEEFEALSQRLVPSLKEALESTGGDAVVCASAEDAHAVRDLHGVPAVHISEFLAGRDLPGPKGPDQGPKVAFFDPCRLGRYQDQYDAPRQLLASVAEVVDLGWTRGEEPCCGVSAWVNCNSWSKDAREAILRRVHDAGVEVLVTACPMCQVHLDCYYSEVGYDPGNEGLVPQVRIADLCEVLVELMDILPEDRDRLEPPEGVSVQGLLEPVDPEPHEKWLDDDAVRATYLCTLCLRCEEVCPQDAPVLENVLSVRQAIWDIGRAPDELVKMQASIETEGNPFGETRSRRTDAYPDALVDRVLVDEERSPDVLLFPGCVYSYQDPRALAAVVRVLEAAGVEYAVLGQEEGCCGYVDHLAGAEGGFHEVASDRMGRFVATGANALVTPCAGCYRTLSQLYAEVDPGWPGRIEVLHLVEYMDRLVSKGDLTFDEGGKVRMVAYHDPCDLGRQCGVYDEPRRVLSALPGVVLEEFPTSREGADCCGGGGGLRAFDVGVSMDIGTRRLGTLVEGIDIVASSCISCKGNLKLSAARLSREGGPRLKVKTVVELVAASLEGGDGR
jgi:Fe-S oxidoreductase